MRIQEEHTRKGKKHILFVLEHFYPYIGGAETLFYLLTKSLAVHGYEITVLTTRHDQNLAKAESIQGVRIQRINCWNRFAFVGMACIPAIRLAKNTDLIFTSSYSAAIPARLAAIIQKKASFIVFHEVWGNLWFKLPYLSWFQRLIYFGFEQCILRLKFDRFIAVSKFTQSALKQKVPVHKIEMIYNGIDYSEFKDFEHQAPTMFTGLFLGRLGVSKGIDILIPAMDEFLRKYDDSKFELILPQTPKKLSKKIRAELNNLKNKDRIIIHSSMTFQKLKRKIARSSCVIVPSYSEGFGFVGVEAAAIGTPIVSSGKGALQETISGKFIELTELSPIALIKALEKAKNNMWDQKEKVNFPLDSSLIQYLEAIKSAIQD